jgi:hypothetical protein
MDRRSPKHPGRTSISAAPPGRQPPSDWLTQAPASRASANAQANDLRSVMAARALETGTAATVGAEKTQRWDIGPEQGAGLSGGSSGPVQLRSAAQTAELRALSDAGRIREQAARGLAGPSQALPHQSAIQASFGPYDLSGVKSPLRAMMRPGPSARSIR